MLSSHFSNWNWNNWNSWNNRNTQPHSSFFTLHSSFPYEALQCFRRPAVVMIVGLCFFSAYAWAFEIFFG